MAIETLRPDLVIRNRSGIPVVIAEVKNLPGIDLAEAEMMRRQIESYREHWPADDVRYFLLMSEDKGFLWDRSGQAPREFSMNRIVDKYLPASERRRPLRERLLERIVRRWLEDVTGGVARELGEASDALAETGMASAVAGGRVDAQPAHWSST